MVDLLKVVELTRGSVVVISGATVLAVATVEIATVVALVAVVVTEVVVAGRLGALLVDTLSSLPINSNKIHVSITARSHLNLIYK